MPDTTVLYQPGVSLSSGKSSSIRHSTDYPPGYIKTYGVLKSSLLLHYYRAKAITARSRYPLRLAIVAASQPTPMLVVHTGAGQWAGYRGRRVGTAGHTTHPGVVKRSIGSLTDH